MTRTPDGGNSLVTLGKIGRVHGIKGWVRLYSFTEPPAGIGEYQIFSSADGIAPRLEMDQIIEQGRSLIAHFVGVDSPEQARELIGMELQVPSKELPDLPKGQYYWHQLEGLLVQNLNNEVLGRIERLLETGAHDVMQVKATEESVDDRERLIPWRPGAVVTSVDLAAGIMTVDWGSDYLA